MNATRLHSLLRDFKSGKSTIEEVIDAISSGMSESIDFATVDHHRELRQGFPEVILCQSKTPRQVAEIGRRIAGHGSVLLATRADSKHFAALKKVVRSARYNPVARTIVANERKIVSTGRGKILIVTAGTSDIPVAEEAIETAKAMGNDVEHLFDVGVAGIHRLLRHAGKLREATVIVVVAGMEGALASVVGGLARVPVIAVPTSVGYGANFQGLSALLGMLNSCAAGVTVVNIDNGFGAGFAAGIINRQSISPPPAK